MAQLINPLILLISSLWRRLIPCRARAIAPYVFLALSTAMGGCKDHNWKLTPVQGTVTQAGQPLAGVRVTFLPDGETGTKGPRASGVTDNAGHYVLHIDTGEPGAIAGHYRVCLYAPRSEDINKDAKEIPRPIPRGEIDADLYDPNDSLKKHPALDRVPLEYRVFDKTPLREEVRSGSQTIDFNIANKNNH